MMIEDIQKEVLEHLESIFPRDMRRCNPDNHLTKNGKQMAIAVCKAIQYLHSKGYLPVWNPLGQPPDTDRVVLVVWEDGAQRMARYMNGQYWFQSERGKHLVNKIGFTHWAELPPAPEGE